MYIFVLYYFIINLLHENLYILCRKFIYIIQRNLIERVTRVTLEFAEEYIYDAAMGGPGYNVGHRSSCERPLHRNYVLYKPRSYQRCSLACLRSACCRSVLNVNRITRNAIVKTFDNIRKKNVYYFKENYFFKIITVDRGQQ